MSGTEANQEEPKHKSSKRIIVVSALVLGVLGASVGEGRFERRTRVEKQTVSQVTDELIYCEVISQIFYDERARNGRFIRRQVIPTGQIDGELCSELIPEHARDIKTYYRIEDVEQEKLVPYSSRNWSKEVSVRGLQALVGAGIGAAFAYFLTTSRSRRRQSKLGAKFSNTSKEDIQTTATGGNTMSTPQPSQSTGFGSVQDRIASAANQEDEVKWMGRFGTWKYIPNRYQAFVASVVSAFLYFNVFEILFQPYNEGGACGTLLRPVFKEEDTPLWIWDTGPWSVDMSLGCPRYIYGIWWEFIASFLALAICGGVLRRSIKRAKQ